MSAIFLMNVKKRTKIALGNNLAIWLVFLCFHDRYPKKKYIYGNLVIFLNGQNHNLDNF